jgi:hypothetical protein
MSSGDRGFLVDACGGIGQAFVKAMDFRWRIVRPNSFTRCGSYC